MIPGTRVKFIGPRADIRPGSAGTIIPSAVEVEGLHLLVLDGRNIPADLRAERPEVPVYLVSPDEVEVIAVPVAASEPVPTPVVP